MKKASHGRWIWCTTNNPDFNYKMVPLKTIIIECNCDFFRPRSIVFFFDHAALHFRISIYKCQSISEIAKPSPRPLVLSTAKRRHQKSSPIHWCCYAIQRSVWVAASDSSLVKLPASLSSISCPLQRHGQGQTSSGKFLGKRSLWSGEWLLPVLAVGAIEALPPLPAQTDIPSKQVAISDSRCFFETRKFPTCSIEWLLREQLQCHSSHDHGKNQSCQAQQSQRRWPWSRAKKRSTKSWSFHQKAAVQVRVLS